MKKLVYLLGIVLSIMVRFGFGCFANDPSFSFKPVSGTELKLYCESPVYMMLNGGSEIFSFNGFEASILFDTGDLDIIVGSINSDFDMGQKNFLSGNLYNVGGASAGSKQGSVTGVSFSIISKRNITGSSLLFVDKYGNTPNYGLDTTNDGITLNGSNFSNRDILTGVTNTTYNFVALPCNADNKKPIINTPSLGNTHVAERQSITFITYDWDNTKKVDYWFSGNSVDNILNYVPVPSSKNVDNQEGVDSSKIFVTATCSTCSGSPNAVPAQLTINDWNGSDTINALTWDSERRGYSVVIQAPFDYEVEKEVRLDISVTDRPNEAGATHSQAGQILFNRPTLPNIIRIYPATDTFVSPSKNYQIIFYISDDWAGVDTTSVVITTTYSGKEFVYSGSDLHFQLTGGQPGLGNAGSYEVWFYPKEDFPVLTEVTLYVTGSDLAGSTKSIQSSFTTRPECSFFGCIDSVNIIGGGINEIFTGIILSVTGTNPNSPYPYLTGEILMCGKDWSGTAIGGNIYLYDASGNRLNNVWYTGNELFITGLNIEYQDGVVSVE